MAIGGRPSGSAMTMRSAAWEGGVCPFGVGWRLVMMWWFVVSDGLLFAAFLASYGYARLVAAEWPVATSVFSLPFLTAMTVTLIASGATMAQAVAKAQHGISAETSRLLWLTAAIGLVFLGMQGYEWQHAIGVGARLHTNPWGAAPFGAYFFIITGFHGLHVLTGAVILAVAARRAAAGRATVEGIEMVGLYWHLVELIWVFIFTLFYLM